MTRVFAGVDGGGSRTRVLLVDGDGCELSRFEGPAGAVDAGDPGAAGDRVAERIREAAAAAGVRIPIAAVWAGLAGAGRDEARFRVEEALAASGVAGRVRVGTDAEAAFHDAFGRGPGILLISGTGSVAWGRNAEGVTARAGGWGPLLGDEGSGHALGVEALRAVVRGEDGRGGGTALRDPVLAYAGVGSPEGLVAWAAGAGRSRVAGLAPVVARVAETGDEVARTLLRDAAAALGDHVAALLERLGPWNRAPEVALAGGLLAPGSSTRARVEADLRHRGLAVAEALVRPERGAAALARALDRPGR